MTMPPLPPPEPPAIPAPIPPQAAGPAPAEPLPPQPRERASWRTPVAWIALLLVGAFMIGMHTLAGGAQPAHGGAGAPAAPAEPENDRSVMLMIVGRYALGVKGLGATSPALANDGAMTQIVGTIDDQARSPTEKVRAVMLAAELSGAESARVQAEGLAADESLDAGLREDAALIVKALDPARPAARDALTDEEKDRLSKRHHWFAHVLLAHGLADTDPARAAILSSGARALFVVLGAVGIVLLAFCTGVILFVVAVVLLASGQVRPAYRADAALPGSSAAQRAALLESLVLFVVAILVLGLVADLIEIATGVSPAFALMWLGLPIALWPRLWGMDRALWKRAMGWHTGRGVFTELGAGIVGYITMLPIVAVGLAATIFLVYFTDARPSHPVVEQAAAGGWWNSVSILILACLWAPVCEETFFRGAMYAHCRRWMGPILSALIIAFVFAAIHPQGWAVVPSLMALAVGFALIREWRGSLIAPITAHAIQNGFVMTMNLLLLG